MFTGKGISESRGTVYYDPVRKYKLDVGVLQEGNAGDKITNT